MKKNQVEKPNQKNENMLIQKTNEDYNKQKPNPKDPNQNNEQKKWHKDTIMRKYK